MTSVSDIRAQYPQYADLSDGDLLMGLHRKHYADMHPRAFLSRIEGAENAHVTIKNDALKKHWRTNAVKPMEGETDTDMRKRIGGTSFGTDVGKKENRLRHAVQGGTIGFGDEIVARGASIASGSPYEYELNAERARLEQGKERFPTDSLVSEMVGATAIPVGTVNAATLPGRIKQGAQVGAAYGAGYGFGSGEGGTEERVKGAAQGAIIGGVAGGAIPAVGHQVGKKLTQRAEQKAISQKAAQAEDVVTLRTEAGKIYQSARDRDVKFKKSSFSDFVDGLVPAMDEAGIDKVVTPKAFRALQVLKKAQGKKLSWSKLETMRRVASNASTTPDPNERRLAGSIVDSIDEFVYNVVDGDLAKGSAQGLGDDLAKARELWRRMRNSEVLQNAMYHAQDAASGFENGLRIEFRKIINNKKLFNRLSDMEKQAVRDVVRGTTMGNWLKRLSRFSFGGGAQTNVLGATVGVGAGGMAGGPVGAMLVPLAGEVGRVGSQKITQGLASRAQGVTAAGGGKLPAAIEAATGINRALPLARLPVITTER